MAAFPTAHTKYDITAACSRWPEWNVVGLGMSTTVVSAIMSKCAIFSSISTRGVERC